MELIVGCAATVPWTYSPDKEWWMLRAREGPLKRGKVCHAAVARLNYAANYVANYTHSVI